MWSGEKIQEQLQGAVRKIADQLAAAGYERTSKQCREKVKSLKRRYKEVVDRLRRSGIGMESDDEDVTARDFKWFHQLHAVMKSRPVSNPRHVVDSARPSKSSVIETSPLSDATLQASVDGKEDSADDDDNMPSKEPATAITPEPLPPKKRKDVKNG